jgi:hypothetical protein
MSIGSSASDLGLVILLLVPGLLAPVALVGALALAARALRLPGIAGVLLGLGLLAAVLAGGSLALDSAGRDVLAVVERRDEAVDLRPQGDWRHELQASLRYRLDGAAEESAVTLGLPPAQFDRLAEGRAAELRVLPLFRSLALVRLAGTRTADFVPWPWLIAALAALPALWLAARLLRSTAGGVAIIALAVAVAAGAPLWLAHGRWRASEDVGARPLRAGATVIDVTRVTQVDPLPCRPGSRSRCERRDTRYDVAQPYDIVQLRLAPSGAAGDVIAVDAVDAGGVALTPGQIVEVAYASGAPREAVIVGATHAHHWTNALAVSAWIGGAALLVAGGLWALVRIGRRPRARASVAS